MQYTDVLPLLRTGARAHVARRAFEQWVQTTVDESDRLTRDLALERERGRCEWRDADRLARELGEDLLQDLGAIAFFVAAARHEAERQGATLGAPLERISELLVGTMRHCRSAAEEHAHFATRQHGLLQALEQLVASANRRDGPRVRLSAEPTGIARLPDADAHELWRIAEEAVLNARRQKAETQVVIRVRVGDGQLTLEIEDDGECLGSAQRSVTSTGMELASYRARSLGGRLELCPGRAAGLLVRCRVPLGSGRDEDATPALRARDAAVVVDGRYSPS